MGRLAPIMKRAYGLEINGSKFAGSQECLEAVQGVYAQSHDLDGSVRQGKVVLEPYQPVSRDGASDGFSWEHVKAKTHCVNDPSSRIANFLMTLLRIFLVLRFLDMTEMTVKLSTR